jgi:hypothetical protein
MVDLLVLGVVGAVVVLYLAERVLKARRRGLRLRQMSDRLDAATRRAEQEHERQEAVATASAELTAYIPAINHTQLTTPGRQTRIGRRPSRRHPTGPRQRVS